MVRCANWQKQNNSISSVWFTIDICTQKSSIKTIHWLTSAFVPQCNYCFLLKMKFSATAVLSTSWRLRDQNCSLKCILFEIKRVSCMFIVHLNVTFSKIISFKWFVKTTFFSMEYKLDHQNISWFGPFYPINWAVSIFPALRKLGLVFYLRLITTVSLCSLHRGIYHFLDHYKVPFVDRWTQRRIVIQRYRCNFW